MTPKQLENRNKIFRALTRFSVPLTEIIKQPDVTDYEEVNAQKQYLARQGEPMMIADSRFSDVWLRILSHLAADEVCKRKLTEFKLTAEAEGSLEEWESYIADLIWEQEIGREAVDQIYDEGKGFPLF